MGRVSRETGKLLATGHQRHYSILYDNAVHTIGKARLLGDLHSIRAQWHRGNLPGNDSWKPALPGDESLAKRLAGWKKDLETAKASDVDALRKRIAQLEAQIADKALDASQFGYTEIKLPDGTPRSPMEELIRWRLWNRTGGGLMAELGSHQLDAAGIFVSAMHGEGKKVKPLTVTAVGNRSIFPADREIEDHVYCMYEYPAPGYDEDKNKKIVVTYSSINGNGFGEYGEVVMGTKGTLVLEREQEVMLYKGSAKDTRVTVAKAKDGSPTLDTTESGAGGGAAAASAGKSAALQAGGGDRRRRDRAGEQRGPGEPGEAGPHRVQAGVVRHRQRRDAGGREARRVPLPLQDLTGPGFRPTSQCFSPRRHLRPRTCRRTRGRRWPPHRSRSGPGSHTTCPVRQCRRTAHGSGRPD